MFYFMSLHKKTHWAQCLTTIGLGESIWCSIELDLTQQPRWCMASTARLRVLFWQQSAQDHGAQHWHISVCQEQGYVAYTGDICQMFHVVSLSVPRTQHALWLCVYICVCICMAFKDGNNSEAEKGWWGWRWWRMHLSLRTAAAAGAQDMPPPLLSRSIDMAHLEKIKYRKLSIYHVACSSVS